MSSGGCMYSLRPMFDLPQPLQLPTNMYTLSPVSGEKSLLNSIQHKNSDCKSADLERRWDAVLEQLQQLKQQLADIRKSVQTNTGAQVSSQPVIATTSNLEALEECVVNADPARPPYSLLLLRKLLTNVNLVFSCHTHSSTSLSDVQQLSSVFTAPSTNPSQPTIRIFIIWKKGMVDPELVISRIRRAVVVGEVNMLRYLARTGIPLGYNDNDETSLVMDGVLDTCHAFVHTTALKDRQVMVKQLDASLGGSGDGVNVCDVAAWAAIKSAGPAIQRNLTPKLVSWYNRLEQLVN